MSVYMLLCVYVLLHDIMRACVCVCVLTLAPSVLSPLPRHLGTQDGLWGEKESAQTDREMWHKLMLWRLVLKRGHI